MKKDLMMQLLTKKEALCPELKNYLRRTKNFTVIQHPLLYSVPHSTSSNAFCNYRLKMLKEHRDGCLKKKDWSGYIGIHEKPYRLEAFIDIEMNLTDAEYWELAGEIWIGSENIWQNRETWKSIFKNKRGDKHMFMPEEDFLLYYALPDELTVYRGCAKHNQIGFSYTLDREKAVWFANVYNRNNTAPVIIERKVKKSEIFAYLGGRREKEVIILK